MQVTRDEDRKKGKENKPPPMELLLQFWILSVLYSFEVQDGRAAYEAQDAIWWRQWWDTTLAVKNGTTLIPSHHLAGRTVSDGQLNWGGPPPKCTGGAKVPSNGWIIRSSVKQKGSYDCRPTSREGRKSGLVIRVVP